MSTTTLANIAAVLTTLSFLPQAIKTIRTRDTRSISLPMYAMFFVGVVLWLIYGYMTDNGAIFYGNIICAILSGIILGYKIRETLTS
jgi:MtN3 and saliva related transmembrane protein